MARLEVPQSHDAAEISAEAVRAAGNGMWDDISAWVAHRGAQVQALMGDVPHLPADLRERAGRALRDLETRRTRLRASLEAQVTRLADGVVERLTFASRDQIAHLRARISELEQRLDTIARQSAPRNPLSVDS